MTSSLITDIEIINNTLLERNPFSKPPYVGTNDIWAEEDINDLETLNAHGSDAVMQALQDIKVSTSESRSNSIVIMGAVQIGKTHLIRRIRRKVKNLKSGLFLLIPCLDVNRPWESFQNLASESLDQLGGFEVTQWQELATVMTNSQYQNSPKDLLKKFDQAPPVTVKETIKKLTIGYCKAYQQKKLDPDIVRAIFWTLVQTESSFAVKWLGGHSLAEYKANELRLPPNNQAFTTILGILKIISLHKELVICFDELDTIDSNDQGMSRQAIAAQLIKDLFQNLYRGIIVTFLSRESWTQFILRQVPQAIWGRMTAYGEPIILKPLDVDSSVALVELVLGNFYKEYNITPPHSLYPFSRDEFIAVSENKLSPRKLLEWCRDNLKRYLSGNSVIDVIPSRVEEAFCAELNDVTISMMDDNSFIASALFYSFQQLIGQTINNIRIDSLEDKLYGKRRDMHLNFKIIGFDQDKPMRIGVAVLQQDSGQSLGAGLKKLKDYQQFDLTRGCLVRSKSKPIGKAVKIKHINPLTQELGGEFVDLKFEEIKPLIALYRIYQKRDSDYEISEADIRQFIENSGEKYQIGHHNPLIQEILSDPSGIAPDTPEEPEIEPSETESTPPENTNDQELDQFFSL